GGPAMRMQLRGRRGKKRPSSYLVLAGLGTMAATYFFDPAQGARRRSYMRDRLVHAAFRSKGFLSKAGRDSGHTAQGLASSLSHMMRAEQVSDAVLVDRVRAELGRCTSRPHAVCVSASKGEVMLSGDILAREKRSVLSCVRRVRGVREVVDMLEEHAT